MCVVQEGLPTDYMAKGGLADIERLGLATRRLQRLQRLCSYKRLG